MRAKLVDAKAACRLFLESKNALRQHLTISWRLGQKLSILKEDIPRGQWEAYLFAQFPELGRTDETRQINARRCMRLFDANQEKRKPFLFDPGSVRKFWWYYVSVKVRVAHKGDVSDKPSASSLTFVNNFRKWDQRVKIRLEPSPDVEKLRHHLKRVVRRIAELCGADWVESLLHPQSRFRD